MSNCHFGHGQNKGSICVWAKIRSAGPVYDQGRTFGRGLNQGGEKIHLCMCYPITQTITPSTPSWPILPSLRQANTPHQNFFVPFFRNSSGMPRSFIVYWTKPAIRRPSIESHLCFRSRTATLIWSSAPSEHASNMFSGSNETFADKPGCSGLPQKSRWGDSEKDHPHLCSLRRARRGRGWLHRAEARSRQCAGVAQERIIWLLATKTGHVTLCRRD